MSGWNLGLGLGLGTLRPRGSARSYDAASQAYFDAMTSPPSTAFKNAFDNLVVGAKTSGDWGEVDVFYALAGPDSQAARLNGKSPGSLTLALVNAPAFTAFHGFKGDGVAAQITSAYSPAGGPAFTLNSASLGLYVRQPSTISSSFCLLAGNSRVGNNSGSTAAQMRLNDGTSANLGTPAASHYWGRRTGAAARAFYKDAALVVSDAVAATSIASSSITLLSAPASGFSDAELAFAWFGSGNVSATWDELVRVFLDEVGAI